MRKSARGSRESEREARGVVASPGASRREATRQEVAHGGACGRQAAACLGALGPSPHARRCHVPPRTPLTLPRSSPLLSLAFSLASERARRHRRAPPHTPSPPRPLAVLASSASTPSFLPTDPRPSGSPATPPPSPFRRRPPKLPSVDSPDPVPPLPRQQHQKNRGEPLLRFPHASLSNSPPSRINHRSRELFAAGHVAAVATVA